ncbi:MAG: protein kinase [Bacteroidetes bacterium]|jgi:hypothetical protein|nr:protein kinase [Bacteroidota bacterium]
MARDALVGQEVDGYRILEVLGRGGMGVVYRAENLSLGRIEALKVIAPALVQDAQFLRRFRMEAQALAQIHHPNIVTVFAQRHAAMGVYLTMEYVEGQTLADVLDARGPLPWTEAWPLMKQLLQAFAYAHERGIIHRDIKPRNIMLTPERAVKVMDFGLARFYQQHELTQTQGVAGTLYYMSPEQIKGSRTLDQRSDIFSLGMTLYQMLSGRLPFDKTESQYTIQRSIVEGRLPRPEQFNAEVPQRLADLVMRALETKLPKRYQKAGEFLDALQAFDDERTLTAAAPGPEQRVMPKGRHTRWSPTLWGGVAVLLIGSLGWWMLTTAGTGVPEEPAIATTDAWTPQAMDAADDSAAAAQAAATEAPARLDLSAAGGAGSRAGADHGLAPSGPAVEASPPGVPAGARATPEGVADEQARTEQARAASPGAAVADAAQTTPSPARPPAAMMPDDGTPLTAGPPRGAQIPATSSGEQALAREDEGRARAVGAESAPSAAPSAEALIQADLEQLAAQLQRAIIDNEWAAVPTPLAQFYQEMLAPVYARHRIHHAAIVPGTVQVDDGGARVPVRIFVEYQQRGREGLRSVPMPGVWVWAEAAEGYALARAEAE